MRGSRFARWNGSRERKGLAPWDPLLIYKPRGVPDVQIGLEINTSSEADRTLAGIMEQRSQLHVLLELWQDRAGLMRALGRESCVIAWPPAEPEASMLADQFDQL